MSKELENLLDKLNGAFHEVLEYIRGNEDKVYEKSCSQCNAGPKESCRTKQGFTLAVPHQVRVDSKPQTSGHWVE